MMKRTFCMLMVALAPLAAAAEAEKAPVVLVPASDARIQYIGRFDVSNTNAPRFTWSGSRINVRCQAERITLLKDAPPADRTDDSGASFRNWFDVLIDGQLVLTIVAKPDRTRYEIPCPPGNGAHTISVFKRTEAVVGVCTFLGFELSEGANQSRMADMLVKAIAAETGWTFAEEDATSRDGK